LNEVVLALVVVVALGFDFTNGFHDDSGRRGVLLAGSGLF